MSLNEILRDTLGCVKQNVNEVRGIQVTYTLHTGLNPLVPVVFTVFCNPTPTDWRYRRDRGFAVEETRDVFEFSREAFKVGTTFHRPTNRDFFNTVADPSRIYKVRDISEPDAYTSYYALDVHEERDIYFKG